MLLIVVVKYVCLFNPIRDEVTTNVVSRQGGNQG